MVVGAVSGYFNPIHEGHVRMIHAAKQLCDELVVIVNNDKQQVLKKGKIIMTEDARCEIVAALRDVDRVVLSVDDDKTVRETLRKVKPNLFFNGGDRKSLDDIPEGKICKEINCEIVFNVGGGKVNSSSDITGEKGQ